MRILVPTDFSECAFNAVNYAVSFANYVKGEVILVHSIIYNQSTFINESEREEENTRRYNVAKDKMNELISNLNNKNREVRITTRIEGGAVLAGIETILEDEKIDLVIMGTEGATGIKAALFGSYTTDLMKHASCPVLAIPPSVQFQKLNYILCATETHPSEFPAITNLIKLVKAFNSKITFLYINSDHPKQTAELHNFESTIKKIAPYDHTEFRIQKDKDVVETLESSACEGRYDVIVTLGRHRNFLDKLIGISVSKRLCLHTAIPILSFPHADF